MQQQAIQHKKKIVEFDEARLFLQMLLFFAHFFPCLSFSLVFFISFRYKRIQNIFFSYMSPFRPKKKTHTQMNHSKKPNEIVQIII